MGVTGVSNNINIRPKVSSSAVKSDIKAALKRHAKDDAQQISVEVQGADVTLTGTVHSWPERELVTHSAWGTPGVRNVVDNMTVPTDVDAFPGAFIYPLQFRLKMGRVIIRVASKEYRNLVCPFLEHDAHGRHAYQQIFLRSTT